MLQRYPPANDDVRITLPPGQNDNGPPAVIVGIAVVVELTVVTADTPPHSPVVVTLKLPDAVTVIL